MPAALEKLVKELQAKGHNTESSYAIATSILQKNGTLQKGTQKLARSPKKKKQNPKGR